MITLNSYNRNSVWRRIIAFCALFAFFLNTLVLPVQKAFAQEVLGLPEPGVRVGLSPQFDLPVLKGIKVYPENPFRFDFILNKGNAQSSSSELKEESVRLIKYFLASLTVPEKDMWVNLSPYEKDRIVPDAFGLTEMGKDLLAQDYLLKQITASLIYPEDEIGKKFWKKVYDKAFERYGTTDISVDTFNKVWIVPDSATVYENADAGTAYVVKSRLKVMLDSDYLSLEKNADLAKEKNTDAKSETQELTKNVIREIVIPELEKEVNEGKNFTKLRQVYQSLILAAWFKKKITGSILSKVYVDQKKVAGVNVDDPEISKEIWAQYVRAFKKGAYNYIKEEHNPVTQEVIARKYFSGGVDVTHFSDMAMSITKDAARLPEDESKSLVLEVNLKPANTFDQDRAQGSIKRVALRTAVALLIAGSIGTGSLYFYGKHLINSGFLGNGQSITQTMSNVQITLDPRSEQLLLNSKIFEGYYPKAIADLNDHLRSYLFRFSVEKRWEILQALDRLQQIQLAKKKIDPLANMMMPGEIQDYPVNSDLFSLIEFLELGYLYNYQDRYMQAPLRLPGRILFSSDDAKKLWEAFSGKKYDLTEIIVDGFQGQGPFSMNVSNAYGSEKHWNVSYFLLALGKANMPLEAKLEYIRATHEAGRYSTLQTEAYDKMYTELNKIEDSFWQNDTHKRRAMIFVSEYFRYTNFMPIQEKIIEHHGGWKTVLTKISQSPALLEKITKEQDDLNQFAYNFQLIEGQYVLPKFLRDWNFEQIYEFYRNFKVLAGEKDVGHAWGRFFVYYDQTGFPISTTLPLKLADPNQKIKVLSDYLNGWPLLKDGTVRLASRDDYQTFESAWQLFISVGNEKIINDKTRSIVVDLRDWKVLAYVVKKSSGISPVFKQRLLESLKLVYDQIRPMRIDNYSAFLNAINTLNFLKQFYVVDAKAYPKYLIYAKALVGADVKWEKFIPQLSEDGFEGFLTFINVFREINPTRAEGLVSAFIQNKFPDFTKMENMENLFSVEEAREKLNKISPILGDEFIITIARSFINTHPVTSENIQELLKIAKVWRYQSPNINRDVQELYKLVGYFIANEIYSFLQVNDIKGKANILEELKGLGLIVFETDHLNAPQAKIDKLAVNIAQLNGGYLYYKVKSKLIGNGELAHNDIGVENNNDLVLPPAYLVRDVVKNGKKIGYVFTGDPKKGARISVRFDVGFLNGGVSAKKFSEYSSKAKLVLDFPLGFTTGNGKPTDIAVENGEVKNWLMSMDRAHGLLIVYKNGSMRIVDKRTIQVKDLYLHPEENKYLDRVLDLKKLDDYFLFISIARAQKLSITANMLLINNDERLLIQDGQDSRRLLLEFSDGQIGVLNMNVPASTAEATRVAAEIKLPNGAKVVRAIYADTGYYDYFTVHSMNKGDVVLGHSDNPSSSNRIFLEQNEVGQQNDGSGVSDKAMTETDLGGIDLNPNKMHFELQNNGDEIKFNFDPAMIQQLQNIPGFTPVVISIHPLNSVQMFLGLRDDVDKMPTVH